MIYSDQLLFLLMSTSVFMQTIHALFPYTKLTSFPASRTLPKIDATASLVFSENVLRSRPDKTVVLEALVRLSFHPCDSSTSASIVFLGAPERASNREEER